jgi:hypothetical protein
MTCGSCAQQPVLESNLEWWNLPNFPASDVGLGLCYLNEMICLEQIQGFKMEYKIYSSCVSGVHNNLIMCPAQLGE